jgi:hypothetical protein
VTTRIDREAELLLACAGVGAEAAGAAHIDAVLQGEVDWARAIRLALRHRLIPHLYSRLSAGHRAATPPQVLGDLRRRFYAIAAHNQLLEDELLRLLRALEAQRLPAIPFKGPALAASAYRNPSLRMSSDLDILVDRRDVARAVALLAEHGYQQVFQHGRLYEAIARPFRHAHNLTSDDGRRCVDLHWTLAQRYFAFALDPRGLWERLETAQLGGAAIRVLAPEDTLLFLCAHGARHGWARVAWVCDVAELLATHPQLRWDAILGQARAIHCDRTLLLGLLLARDLLGATLPDALARLLAADRVAAALAGQVAGELFADAPPRADLALARFYLRSRERWWDKAQYGPELLRVLLASAGRWASSQ